MSGKEEESGVDMLPMPKLTETDDPTSQEIVALINTFTDHERHSLENDDGWKDFKAALWDTLTTWPGDESSSNRNGVAAPDEKSSDLVSSQTNTITSQVYEVPELASSSIKLTTWGSDSDTASDFTDFSAKQSYLPDLLRILNENEIEPLNDEESGTTRLQFHGKEYILSNGPHQNADPFVDNVLINGFESFEFQNRGHNEDAPAGMSEEIESDEGIFKVWDLGLPIEEDEITRQLKALAESNTGLSTQNQSANSSEETLHVSMVKAENGYVSMLPTSDDLRTTLNEGNLDELIQGVTNLSLNHA